MSQKDTSYSYRHQWKSFFRLVRRAKVPWYLFILTFLMDAISATLFVKLPVLLGDIMQGAIFDGGQITQYGLLSAVQVAFSFLTILVFNWVDIKINLSSSVGIWNKIIQLPMRALMKEKPSTLTSRVTDDSTGVGLAISGIFNCLSMLYTMVITYYEMFQMNTNMSLVLLIVPVWMVISMKIIGNMSYRAQKKIQDTLSVFTSYLSVRLPNMRQVKAFGMEEQECSLGADRIHTQYNADMTMVKVSALSFALQSLSTTICNVVVLAWGSYLVSTGGLDVGDLITYFLFVTQGNFTFSTETLLLYYQNIKAGLGACSKVMEMMELEEEAIIRDKSFTVPEADIRFEHVTFSYDDTPVLKDVSFTIPKGKTTAIAGANGSGKTTVLKLLERFYAPDSGSITYGGENIERYHLNDWRNSIGYVVQNSPLLQGTVAENITYGMEQPDRDSAVQAAKEADAYEFIIKMSDGFDSEVGELGCKLSGGQRQKIAIARAMINRPEMVLLDEATCGLDAHSEQEILQALDRTLAQKTVIKVAHGMEAIRDADQIIVLRQGEVVDVGTHDKLLERSEYYRKLCACRS